MFTIHIDIRITGPEKFIFFRKNCEHSSFKQCSFVSFSGFGTKIEKEKRKGRVGSFRFCNLVSLRLLLGTFLQWLLSGILKNSS